MGWELGRNHTYRKRFFTGNSMITSRVRGVAGKLLRGDKIKQEVIEEEVPCSEADE